MSEMKTSLDHLTALLIQTDKQRKKVWKKTPAILVTCGTISGYLPQMQLESQKERWAKEKKIFLNKNDG